MSSEECGRNGIQSHVDLRAWDLYGKGERESTSLEQFNPSYPRRKDQR
jgi:hypothetical protein